MRILVSLFLIMVLSACGAGSYGSSYHGYLTPEMASNVVMLGDEQEPNLILSNNLDRDVQSYLEHNYVVIGESAFNGLQESPQNAVKQAKEVRATHVIVSSAYTGTESRLDYDYQDVYHTVFVNRVRTVNGKTVNVTEAVTVRDTVSVPYLRQYDKFDQWAVYLVKSLQRHKLGILMRDLNQDDRLKYKRNTGAYIDVVLSNSPAFLADIIRGDILLAINGNKVFNSSDAVAKIRTLDVNGTKVVLSLLKEGQEKEITLEFIDRN
ncbi:MAG: PDZ domain-containing protein [Kordiimonadaceae bacterium]|nr:PDZ domain-containing protein [Kordiimonadaceae bacterium]